MGITGPFQRLKKLGASFKAMGGREFTRGLSKQMGEHMRDLVVRCIDTSTDPYGKRYAPLKHRRGRPLMKSGRMRASIGYLFSSIGWRIVTAVYYASFQNQGTRTIPARQFIPMRGLPALWRRSLTAQGNSYIRRHHR